MIVSSSPSANLFLTAAQPAQARPARAKPELPLPESNPTLSAAGQLRGALERLGATTLGLDNTSVFAPKPLRAEQSAGQHADQEKAAQQRRPDPAEPLLPAFIPAPPPDIKPQAASASRETVSLQQFISEGEKFSLRLNEQRKIESRAAGVFEAESVFAPRKPGAQSEIAPRAAPAEDGIKRAPSLAASASTQEPAPSNPDPATPVLAPLPAPTAAPVPTSLPNAARELTGAVNELRSAVNRTENSASNDAATRGLRDRAERALAAVDRHATSLQRVGIERNAQGALQVNEPVLQSTLARAPQQVQQALSETRQEIATALAPPPPLRATLPDNTDNTDNLTRVLREPPAAPRRAEAPAPATPPPPAVLLEQAQQLGKTLDSIATSGLQLQRELAREDAQSSSQSSLINRLNTIAHALTP
jgi:hypothetical protein